MEAKTKSKVGRYKTAKICLISLIVILLSYYIWNKICHVASHKHTQSSDWWYFDLLWAKSTDGSVYSALFKAQFYKDLIHSIYEDFINFMAFVIKLALHTGVISNVNVYIFLVTCIGMALISYIIFYTYRYKDQVEMKENEQKRKAKTKRTSSKDNNIVEQPVKSLRKKLYRRWVTGLLFFAFLISIPWEFVRLYQTMVAEKITQMKVGIPPECLPEDMSFYQRVRSFLRMQLSWADDPCLVYHKALLVDPMWQVNPLMVITSAFSQCIVYPAEILFGGLGRSLRLFFAEIPAQWQPFMLIVIVFIMILTLIMAFGYRIHLPFLLKIEPKSPRYVRYKQRSNSRTDNLQNGDSYIISSQDSFDQSILDSSTQYTVDSQQ